MAICPGSGCAYQSVSSSPLILNVWQVLVGTYDGSHLNVYINGTLTSSVATTYSLPTITRIYNYIGQADALSGNGYSWSYLDDLRFYNIYI